MTDPTPSCTLDFNPISQTVGDSRDFTIQYTISNQPDIDAATALLQKTAPTRVGIMWPHHYSVEPIASGTWTGKAIYQPAKPLDKPTFSIEIGTASVKATQSLQTMGRYGTDSSVPDFKGAIGVTKEGVEGVDIMVPTITWNERQLLPNSQVNQSYIKTLLNTTAKMNDAQFRIFASGEALFLGGTLAQSTERDGWEANFRWLGSPNDSNIAVGGITVAQKLGHDYLWIKYNENSSNGATVKIPKYAFVERVYKMASMDALNLQDPT